MGFTGSGRIAKKIRWALHRNGDGRTKAPKWGKVHKGRTKGVAHKIPTGLPAGIKSAEDADYLPRYEQGWQQPATTSHPRNCSIADVRMEILPEPCHLEK